MGGQPLEGLHFPDLELVALFLLKSVRKIHPSGYDPFAMHVLILKLSALGDVVHTFPVLSLLKAYDPAITIDWIVERPCASLVQAHPYVNRVIQIDSKRWRRSPLSVTHINEMRACVTDLRSTTYDVVFDLQGNIKSSCVLFFTKAVEKVGFALQDVAEWPNILFTKQRYKIPKSQNIREDYLSLVREHLKIGSILPKEEALLFKLSLEEENTLSNVVGDKVFENKTRVLLCPGANWINKCLSRNAWIEFFQEFEKQASFGVGILWGNEEERRGAEELHQKIHAPSFVLPKLSLPLLQRLMASVDIVFSMDSLPLHLCGTTETPSFSVFGPSLAAKYRPLGSKHTSLQGGCPYNKTFPKRCPILRTCSTGACMRELTGKEVFASFREYFKDNKKFF